MTKPMPHKRHWLLLQIVHLDLKSHNILLGRGGIAKIADVGLVLDSAHVAFTAACIEQ